MENPDFGEELSRLDIDKVPPERLFDWARQKQQYKRDRVSDEELPEAIEHVVDMLEGYISRNFDLLPEVTVFTRDAFYGDLENIEFDAVSRKIKVKPLPYVGVDALTGEHEIRGRLFGFHRGEMNDLRMYVDTYMEPIATMGGQFSPLISVGVEKSKIQLAEQDQSQRIESIKKEISQKLAEIGSDDLNGLFLLFEQKLNEPQANTLKRLKGASQVVLEMLSFGASKHQTLLDDFYDLIRVKLNLLVPYTIDTTSYRVVMTRKPIASYKPAGPERFIGVVPEIEAFGESVNRSLGLLFMYGDQPVQVPIQNITDLRRTDS